MGRLESLRHSEILEISSTNWAVAEVSVGPIGLSTTSSRPATMPRSRRPKRRSAIDGPLVCGHEVDSGADSPRRRDDGRPQPSREASDDADPLGMWLPLVERGDDDGGRNARQDEQGTDAKNSFPHGRSPHAPALISFSSP